MTGWTGERAEQLKAMWSQGYSAAQIARALGGVTRNAVIGKVRRMGLDRRRRTPARTTPRRARLAIVAPPPPPPPPPPEEPAIVLEDGARLTLVQLTDRTCRWPVGDPQDRDFHFCGREPELGRPYCPAHVAKAYVATAKPGRGKGEHAIDRNDAVATGRARIFGT